MLHRSPLASRISVAAFWAACAAVAALSLAPVEHLPPQVFDIWDKAQHAAGFAALAFLGRLAYPSQPSRLLVALLVYGALIEVAQAATGWRQGDVKDWIADAVGVVIGLALFRLLFPVIPSRSGTAQ